MNADNDFLASAYLDGELTDAERIAAESDPAVMAEVESLRALRARLTDVEAAPADARERAIAAAMAVYAERSAVSATIADESASVVSIGRRRDPMRWLSVAAAVVVVGLLGVVVASGLGGGDTDDVASDRAGDEPASETILAVGDGADAADDGAAAERLPQSNELDEADDAASTLSDAPLAEVADEPAEEPAADADDGTTADDMAGDDMAGDDMAGDDMADEGTDSTFVAAGEADPETGRIVLDADEYLDGHPIAAAIELIVVADRLLELIERRELPPTPNHSCPFPDVLADGVFDDPDDLDPPVEIYISVSEADRTVLAIDRETCTVLLSTDLTR